MEIRIPDTVKARAAAKRLQRIFESCSFLTETVLVPTAGDEGIRLESCNANAAVALALQSAFHEASIEILLTIDDRALHNTVTLQLGPNGYD